jgi:hypothetical protein
MAALQDHRAVFAGPEARVDARHQLLRVFVQLAVAVDHRAARRRELDEGEPPAKLRIAGEQLLDGEQALFDPLRVIEAIHADAQQRVRPQPQLRQDSRAALGGLGRHLCPAVGPLDGDRIRAHQGGGAGMHDADALAIDAGLQVPVHRIDEVVAMRLDVKADDAAAEEAFEELLAERTDPEQLGRRPGDVPEAEDGGAREALADELGGEREMVVLDEDDGVVAIDLLADGIGEPLVHALVVRKVLVAKAGAGVRDVAERPEPLVGEAIVVAPLLLGGEPDAA